MTIEHVHLQPDDAHNRRLVADVHPGDWANPKPTRPYHLVVIGAGTAGLVTAAGAAGLGARVALIERELMGGDCLNVGCVPSKALIGAARVAATVRNAGPFGVNVAAQVEFDFGKTMERMRRLRAQISPNDSAQRFRDLGVDVYFGQGEFIDGQTIAVSRAEGSTTKLTYKKAVIAAGARASAPPIPGLDSIEYLTNETLFSLTELPKRFGVIGAGPIGCEMAQSFARFGSAVTLFQRADSILSQEDPEAAAIVQQQLEKDGVQLLLNSGNIKVSRTPEGSIGVAVTQNNQTQTFVVDQLLVAAGRAPNIDGLNLDAVGIDYDHHGVTVNDHLQTTHPRVYAAGDICSQYKFTHAADFQARIVIQNALFAIGPFGKKKASDLIIPWATYTSPEVAQVGLHAADARSKGIAIDTYIQHFDDLDRAILAGQTAGFVKVHTQKGTDRILGATIVSEHAGDLISEITVAMANGLGISKIGSTIHPYPTLAEAIRKIGDQYNRTRLTPFNQRALKLLQRLNVGP